ncbi:MAG: type I-E CRISPR-associated protein Cse1/CasA, partial [Nitrospiraceae bacterium]
TAMPPKDDRAWFTDLIQPPPASLLKQAFEVVAFAFDLDGNGPRFMQDLTLAEGEKKEIGALLIEAPGGNALENNTDFFVKRGFVEKVCLSCAAAALFTLQTNAPSGGVGHRTSLRGGGPLTTLVMGDNLWQTIWLNVLPKGAFLASCGNPRKTSDSAKFPWLAPTRTSERDTGETTTPLDVHPTQMFWGMPRRIRIDFERMSKGTCDVCGDSSVSLVSHYVTKHYGTDYEGAWLHPLTPYSEVAGGPPNPRKGQPGGVHYRYWLGFVQEDDEERRMPARVVKEFLERQFKPRDLHSVLRRAPRLKAFAYDMDNMKARCWYEATMPLFQIDRKIRSDYEAIVAKMVRTAVLIAGNLRRCIKKAMFRDPSRVKGDYSIIDAQFWQTTESAFYSLLEQCREKLSAGDDLTPLKMKWLKTLAGAGEHIFDDLSQNNKLEVVEPKRIAEAYHEMRRLNAPTSKKIRQLLDLPKVT